MKLVIIGYILIIISLILYSGINLLIELFLLLQISGMIILLVGIIQMKMDQYKNQYAQPEEKTKSNSNHFGKVKY